MYLQHNYHKFVLHIPFLVAQGEIEAVSFLLCLMEKEMFLDSEKPQRTRHAGGTGKHIDLMDSFQKGRDVPESHIVTLLQMIDCYQRAIRDARSLQFLKYMHSLVPVGTR